MKIFHLVRAEDVSGISGTGVVAEGVQFQDGQCVLCWTNHGSNHGSVAVYHNLDTLLLIHGHEGKTKVVWV